MKGCDRRVPPTHTHKQGSFCVCVYRLYVYKIYKLYIQRYTHIACAQARTIDRMPAKSPRAKISSSSPSRVYRAVSSPLNRAVWLAAVPRLSSLRTPIIVVIMTDGRPRGRLISARVMFSFTDHILPITERIL